MRIALNKKKIIFYVVQKCLCLKNGFVSHKHLQLLKKVLYSIVFEKKGHDLK
jgi:hypothetical protein